LLILERALSTSSLTSRSKAPSSDERVSASKECARTEGRRRAGWPRRTMGMPVGAKRSQRLSTDIFEGPATSIEIGFWDATSCLMISIRV
jgi:hypothetical protein